MGICAKELKNYVVRPALKHLGMWSAAGENLLLGTAARESGLGFHLKLAHHQALGIYQISPRTHKTIWDSFLCSKPDLSSKVRGLASQREFLSHPHHELATNLAYATAIAYLIYLRSGVKIEKIDKDDINTMARMWQKYFHSRNLGTMKSFCESYQNLIIKSESSNYLDEASAKPA